jgi:protein TonB
VNLFSFHKDNLDEVVFENRNKQYGAYAMRKSYDSNLLKASASSFGVLFLSVGLVQLLAILRPEILPPLTGPVNDNVVDRIIGEFDIILDHPSGNVGIKNKNQNIFTIVKDREMPIQPIAKKDPELPNNPNGSATGTSCAESGTGAGTANSEAINSPIILESPQTYATFVSQMPSFNGGEEAMQNFIDSHIIYPNIARENGIQGKVVLSFVVMEDGSIQHIKVLKGIGFGCDAEALHN